MITVVEPKQHIDVLWGNQNIVEGVPYRLMKYVLCVEYDEKVLLHNTVTGQLVVLEPQEIEVLNKLPTHYVPEMKELLKKHFLVSQSYDEHNQVVNLRKILQKMYNGQNSNGLTNYTIVPTTACNARCYYCFEQGLKPIFMTKQTAYDIVDYIDASHNGDKTIKITWFGGEPTLATERIDLICEELTKRGIKFSSDMISNGYLFDKDMVERAKKIWNLITIQITVDGTEKNYNSIKAYVSARDNPYQRVMQNVGLLLNKEIHVGLRMNFDLNNYQDFDELLNEIKKRFAMNPYLQVAAYPIMGTYVDKSGNANHASDAWIFEKVVTLNDQSREVGLRWYDTGLPSLDYIGCGAANDSFMVINANGTLTRCLEQLGEDQIIGDVKRGVFDKQLSDSWKKIADYNKCKDCIFFPNCVKLMNCSGGDRCYQQDRNRQYITAIRKKFEVFRRESLYEVQ